LLSSLAAPSSPYLSSLSLHDALPIFHALFEGELDTQADRDAVGLRGPLIGRLHDPWPSAGDHRIPGGCDRASHLDGRVVLGGFGDRKSTRLTPVTFRSRMPSSA